MNTADPAGAIPADGNGLVRERSIVDPAVLIGRELDQLLLRRPDLRLTGPAAALPPVWADADQLQRAVANLLDNAAAATPIGGAVTVMSGGAPGRLTIRILDTGSGVPDGDRDRIFDRFVRLSNSRSGGGTGNGSGSGLGLPISRAIVRAHGGDLRCLPWQGGACFELVLPVAVPAPTDRVLQLTG